jgi:hypothetical protein
MNWKKVCLGLALGCTLSGAAALAQQSAPASAAPAPATDGATANPPAPVQHTAQMDAGEPRANTSAPTVHASQSKPAPAPRARGTAAQQPPASNDRVELDTSTVTGNQELPKVMYIVPWKKSDIGDLAGKPMNSLLDEVLAPVDRDVFRREVRYYDAVKPDPTKNGTQGGAPAKQVEK